jgi:hypothetical protein
LCCDSGWRGPKQEFSTVLRRAESISGQMGDGTAHRYQVLRVIALIALVSEGLVHYTAQSFCNAIRGMGDARVRTWVCAKGFRYVQAIH